MENQRKLESSTNQYILDCETCGGEIELVKVLDIQYYNLWNC